MKTELQYRPFSELLDSVKIDLKTLALENMIDEAELIKVALRVNYELGVKINPNRQVILDVENGKTRLPADFKTLNFVVQLLDKKTEWNEHAALTKLRQNVRDELEFLSEVKILADTAVREYSEERSLTPGETTVFHNLKTDDVQLQATTPEGDQIILDYDPVSQDAIVVYTDVFVPGVKLVIMGQAENGSPVTDSVPQLPQLLPDTKPTVASRLSRYQRTRLLHVIPAPGVNPDCVRTWCRDCHDVYLKDRHLVTGFAHGEILVNYQGAMEDEDGQLLVLDHPMANEYYEYALKQRILENLTLSGEPQANNLAFIEGRLRAARNNALSVYNTPEFSEMQRTWSLNRKVAMMKYYHQFLA